MSHYGALSRIALNHSIMIINKMHIQAISAYHMQL